MQCKRSGLVAAFVLMAGMSIAHADVRLGVTLSEFGYSLIDLNPTDGIEPSIQFENEVYSISGGVREGPFPPRANHPPSSEFRKSGLLVEGSSITRGVNGPTSSAISGFSGSFVDRSFRIFASGEAVNSKADPIYASQFGLDSSPALHLVMTVAPFTQVIWSGKLDLAGEQTLGRRGARFEFGSMNASVSLTGSDAGTVTASMFFSPGVVDRRSEMRNIRLSLSNTGADAREAILETHFGAGGTSFFPVPEPGGPILMLCGMGVLASLMRVRRRRGAAGFDSC